jgi:DNA-binding MarR family transcriptional regulator
MPKPPRRDLRALLSVSQGDLQATLDGRLARLGFPALRPVQVALLRQVAAAPATGLRLPELVAALELPKQTVGDMVNDLEHVHLVERVPDPEHGVIKRIRLGAKGRLWAAEVKRCAVTTEARWASRLGHQKMKSLRGLLEELAATVEAADAAATPVAPRRRRGS